MALSKATVTYTVAKRAKDGNATLGESMGAAVKRTPTLLVWSFTDASVGVLVRLIAERSGLVATLIAKLCGASWRVATYFVVPAMMIDAKGPFAAVSRSATVFRQLWGETIVTNVSLTLAFLLGHIVMFLSLVGAVTLGVVFNQPAVALVAALVWIIWFALALILHSVLSSILTTLLYLYATATTPPHNFDQELLGQILVRANDAPITPVVPVVASK